ncbi:MAG: metallophosphoesterase [Deferribacteraceae bacterium]|jgi:predicted MPP superfamily phosphohydrolase|nr:metallophosphoesterase [Deferribacteraceae bacterium]
MFIYKFIAVTLLLCAYTGIHLYAAFGRVIGSRIAFAILFTLFAESYVIVQFFRRSLEIDLPAFFYWFSSAVIGFMSILVMVIVIFDIALIIMLICKRASIIANSRLKIGVLAILATFVIFIYGHINSVTPRVTSYSIEINKQIPDNIRIVAVSDLHIASYTSLNALHKMVERINALSPDIVVMVGDIIDGELQPFIDRDIKGIFSKIESRYGVYSVLGNHEYHGGQVDSVKTAFDDAKIPLLRDEAIYIEPLNLTLVGRDDYRALRYRGSRAPLSKLIGGATDSAIVVLDHQPQNVILEEASASGADLQLSGHTHNGQLFPFNFVVDRIYKNAWGLMTEGAYNLIVSCGFGTWGPSMRTGSYSEIVVVDING